MFYYIILYYVVCCRFTVFLRPVGFDVCRSVGAIECLLTIDHTIARVNAPLHRGCVFADRSTTPWTMTTWRSCVCCCPSAPIRPSPPTPGGHRSNWRARPTWRPSSKVHVTSCSQHALFCLGISGMGARGGAYFEILCYRLRRHFT